MVIKRVLSLMDNRQRRFSTVQQLNPETLKVIGIDERLQSIPDEDVEIGTESGRKQSLPQIISTKLGNLALFRDDDEFESSGHTTAFIGGYTIPGPAERASSEKKKANLGVMLGVYLPTIQHILGVTMFIRLFWVVGIAGVPLTMLMLFICCSCTLLTSISLSAVATNGVVESGGAYFMISRNLGAEFGSAVGILFYLANTVATSMYLVGGVEVFLLYIMPGWTIGGESVHNDVGPFGMMTNNYRIYGTALLLLEVIIVALGVKFVQLLAPVSLACVILSILACFAGGIEKSITHSGQHVCMMDDMLLESKVFMPMHGNHDLANVTNELDNVCSYCFKNHIIEDNFCKVNEDTCALYGSASISCVNGFPGFNGKTLEENSKENFMKSGESIPGRKGIKQLEVFQDFTVGFFTLMAIYFPAVTGIMTGTNMSGDLKDPQKSIPSGTIAATISTSLIYFLLSILFGSSIIGSVLRDKTGKSISNSLVVASLSWPSPWVVIIGSFLSTFGAALQCLCSAPRLLQSIAKDDVIPALTIFSRVTKSNEPFLGLLFTAFIAELAILLGAVDAIAEVLDFFFLMCYAFVNMVCVLHSLLKAPNWRPRFKYYHWTLSVAGAFLCFFIMFASNWKYATIACVLTFAIYKYVEWKGAKKEWGDGIRGLALTTAQYSLQKVEDKDPHPKNWRPQLMILVDGRFSKEHIDLRSVNLLNLAGQMKAGRGLAITVGFVRANNLHGLKKRADEIKERLQSDMLTARIRGFGKSLFYEDSQIQGAVSALFQSVGIGGLRPNTVLLNFPKLGEENDIEQKIFGEQLIRGYQMQMCMVVCKGITDFPNHNERLTGYIDIWWIVNDGGLLMLIAFLMQQHKVWKGCKLRIFVLSENEQDTELMKIRLQKYIYNLRIDALLYIVNLEPDASAEVTDDAVQRAIKSEKSRLKTVKSANGFINAGYQSDDPPSTMSNIEVDRQSHRSNKIKTTNPTSITSTPDRNSTDSSPTPDDFDDIQLDDIKIQKMADAVRLNHVILEYSAPAQLVLLSLPKPPKKVSDLVGIYLGYIQALTEDISRVMLIAGSGKEVITTDS